MKVIIHWDIGEVDSIPGFTRQCVIEKDGFNLISPICQKYWHDSIKTYRLRHPRASWGFCFGMLTLHRDQLTAFLAEFLPVWEGYMEERVKSL